LLGAATRVREATGIKVEPHNLARYERSLAAVRGILGDEAFAAAQDAGRALPIEEAIAAADAIFAAQSVAAPEPGSPPVVEDPGARAGLSPRELEVVRLVAEGRSNQEIGDALFISQGTARTHVQHILTKLGLDSRAAVAAWAVRHGLA
jgi:DNA-binding NarL/FixJ family response regulator